MRTRRRRQPAYDATAGSLLKILGKCPVCSASLEGHSYAHFASTRVLDENQEKMATIFRFFDAEDWQRLVEHQDFDVTLDAFVVFAHRCATGKLVAFLILDPYELYSNQALIQLRVLSEASGQELFYLTKPSSWHPYLMTPAP